MIGREKWAEVIADFQGKAIPDLIEREITVPEEVPLKRAITLIGPRRAGKTYTMLQLIKSLLREKAGIDRIVYINLERTDLEGCTGIDLVGMLETFYEMHPENRKWKIWLFLDEIQNVEGWERFVRTALDRENIQIFLSGSSSKLLSKEIATSLRGRTLSHTILPFSFTDYLIARGIERGEYLSSSQKAEVINRLRTYLTDGGYPEVILFGKEKEKILSDIVETTVYRDVIERYKVRNTRLLRLLIQSLIASAQKEFSVHKFYNYIKSMGMRASKNTLYEYLEALHDVFFAFPVRRFSYSYKEAEQSLPKIYLIDNGILSLNGIDGPGRLMENLVFVELMRRGKGIHHYKSADGKETDFVIVERGRVTQLLQVAYSVDEFGTKEREVNSLLKASEELRCSNLAIITWSREGEEVVKGKRIRYLPLWRWLLSGSTAVRKGGRGRTSRRV